MISTQTPRSETLVDDSGLVPIRTCSVGDVVWVCQLKEKAYLIDESFLGRLPDHHLVVQVEIVSPNGDGFRVRFSQSGEANFPGGALVKRS
jgi:hypothetical protein